MAGLLCHYVVTMKFNTLIPELAVTDLSASLEFYIERLGFTLCYQRPEDEFAFLALGEAQLMLEQKSNSWATAALEHPLGRGLNFQIEVEELGPLLARLGAANYPLFQEPAEEWYRVGDELEGQRQFLVQDPDGYLLRFCQYLGTRPKT